MALNLGDAREWINRARAQHETLKSTFADWSASGGISLLGQRNSEVMRWEFDVVITSEPKPNLSILAGEIFDALRRALDYIAWQVYATGTAERSEKRDRTIYFPIVTDPAGWEQQLQSKVPGASNDHASALHASQPFAQAEQHRAALPTLAAFINRDKHRRLSLFATGAFAVSARSPELDDDMSMILAATWPIPTLHIAEALQEMRGRALAQGLSGPVAATWIIAYVELRRNREGDANSSGDPIPWADGIEMSDPPPPQLRTGFATEDGDMIGMEGLGDLIDHVAGILDRFASLG
ncbi:hypothetical protein MPRF_38980 [Mycolicibacterium parafortuitum]|uniref:Uncharacterized protein n=1 Tax=Mycolicibacterium parafortuitum TaxID=39692 RepID=A0A7I7U8Q3_MYCPF|nr:hypothetical protein [Mycolicibacterium parafortuitum]BBY76999.1 hypothetical protein MPRF_38980 [Mycolicibacterium parafortuitum]